jgi:hypothetical protein
MFTNITNNKYQYNNLKNKKIVKKSDPDPSLYC